ncbi:MAG TPA: acetylornithine transaminase [Chloroflexota bacterium]|jgi:acetylornithine aminotransferase/acetylornithine/N-succinyldiaminopimelate aminotransferase|nr:acetylornithine transaminase [Chloroflexota bacterium]
MTSIVDSQLADIVEREHRVYMPTFKRQPLLLVRGEGCYVWDDAGKRYLDLVAGIAVNVLGHAHPALLEALATQGSTLIHTSNLYYTRPQIELAELLVALTGLDQVFFVNSGAEANETAIKLARKFGKRYRNGAFAIITARASFHGRTLTTVAATGQEKYQAPFTPLPPGFSHVPYNDLDALRQATTSETVAVMLEPVQGESGIHLAQERYLQAVRRHCDEHGLLLILDEVQSGIGRTGEFLASQGYGVQGDIVTLAKGLCGGLPAGAALARGAASCFEPGDHGSTMGGNPLVCAAGLATLRTIRDEGIMEHVRVIGAYFLQQLESLQQRYPVVVAARGRGLMLAIDLARPEAAAVVDRTREQGLLINSTGPTTVRMVPPLILSQGQVDEAMQILEAAIRTL